MTFGNENSTRIIGKCTINLRNKDIRAEGVARGGGIILNPDEMNELKFSWGIGEDTNNIVEALALWQGLLQLTVMGTTNAPIFGDSRLIINTINSHSLPQNMRLQNILQKNKNLICSFYKIKIFHILRDLNGEASRATNIATLLKKGQLILNDNSQSFEIL